MADSLLRFTSSLTTNRTTQAARNRAKKKSAVKAAAKEQKVTRGIQRSRHETEASDYEKLREQNICRNNNFLRELGL